MSAKVSVIIAAYNVEKTLKQCVISIANQKEVSVEIIIIDDCSDDNTFNVALSLQREHSNIRVLQNEKNSGPSISRNRGIDCASYEWIAVVDADDSIDENRLATMIQYAENHNLDICFDNMNIVLGDAKAVALNPLIKEDHKRLLDGMWTIKMYADLNKPYISPVLIGFLKPLIKKQFIDENKIRYNEKVRNSEDYLFVLEALIKEANVHYIHQTMYQYKVNNNSLSGKFDHQAHQKTIFQEEQILDCYKLNLKAKDSEAIKNHIEALKLAGETNLIFQSFAKRSFNFLIKLFWKNKRSAHIHLYRILKSIFRKIKKINYRGT